MSANLGIDRRQFLRASAQAAGGLTIAFYAGPAPLAAQEPSPAPKPLPELGSSAEQLYAGRCGGCHRPFLPSTMTSAMWAEQVEAMQLKMAQAGVAPLSSSERREVLDYLERNAGKD